MLNRGITRRQLLQTAAAGMAVGLTGLPKNRIVAADDSAALRIVEPFHGAVLNHRQGKQTADSLTIRVAGEAKPGDKVTVNGVACRREGNRFEADVPLRDAETDLVAVVEGGAGRQEAKSRVVWDRYSEPRYRFSIDDSSFFLRDIAKNNYASLFDCFFLKGLRDLHTKYGTKYTVNIYYAVADNDDFPNESSFTLPQFPDRYKSEFRDNAHWLRLAFHAHANMPSRPYQDAAPEKLIADLDQVAAEIHRFAGEEAYAPPTVVHFAMTRHSAFKPLYSRGVRALSGYFRKSGDQYDINYNWDNVHSEYLSKHTAWKDFDSGIVFSRVSIVCNSVPVEKIVADLEPLTKDPNLAEILDLFTHEQYFWPFYSRYIPEHFQRLDTALRWVTEQGYKPVFYHEGLLGGRA